ncbi:MAG TPA: hypothetical protein PKN48_01015 [Bacteroidales bacterium]|nr:hypothetical protein [Bacteroidales bacterium]
MKRLLISVADWSQGMFPSDSITLSELALLTRDPTEALEELLRVLRDLNSLAGACLDITDVDQAKVSDIANNLQGLAWEIRDEVSEEEKKTFTKSKVVKNLLRKFGPDAYGSWIIRDQTGEEILRVTGTLDTAIGAATGYDRFYLATHGTIERRSDASRDI